MESEALQSTNRFFAVNIVPFNRQFRTGNSGETVTMRLRMVLSVFHRDQKTGAWEAEAVNQTKTVTTTCPYMAPEGSGMCSTVNLMYEQAVEHKYYKVSFTLIDTSTDPTTSLIGDCGLQMVTGTVDFSDTEMTVNILFLATSLVLFLAYIWILREHIFHTWTVEQMGTFALLLCIIFYNNPFFSLEYLVAGWFFPFLDSIFKSAFVSLMFFFWFMMMNKFRDSETFSLRSKTNLPMFVACVAYFVFSLVTYSWSSIEDKLDPVMALTSNSISGSDVFYVLTCIVAAAIIFWIHFLAFKSLPLVSTSTEQFTRFVVMALPTLVISISIIVGFFVGGYGALQKSSMELVYYTTLYNCFTWLMFYAYMPAGRQSLSYGNPSVVDEDSEYQNYNSFNGEDRSLI